MNGLCSVDESSKSSRYCYAGGDGTIVVIAAITCSKQLN